MSVAVSRRHREHRSTLAVTSWRNGRVIHPWCSYASATLCATLLRSVGSHYDLHMTNALPRRLCHLGIINLGACATLPLRSWRSGQLQASFKCSSKVGVALLDSMTNSEQFHSCNWRMKSQLPCSLLLLVGLSAHIVAVCLRIIMDGPRTFFNTLFYPLLSAPLLH